jgi:energy-coupling factor transporter ATP-binding protein EcfA2
MLTLGDDACGEIELWSPDDALRVSYSPSGDGRDFKPLEHGSPGQKTAALLAFILSYGESPIILDQPEDDLENRLIYELVVRRIREVKSARQVIAVTHDANIVVNGDSEYVVVFDFSGGRTVIAKEGGLQEQAVREAICEVLEGGRVAFEERYRRIGDGEG